MSHILVFYEYLLDSYHTWPGITTSNISDYPEKELKPFYCQ